MSTSSGILAKVREGSQMQSTWDQDMLLLDCLLDKLERQQQQLEDMLSKAVARINKSYGEYQPQTKHPLDCRGGAPAARKSAPNGTLFALTKSSVPTKTTHGSRDFHRTTGMALACYVTGSRR